MVKIGETQIRQSCRTSNGPEEYLTECYDGEGKKVDETYHVRNPGGEEVTLHGDEAVVQRPDGRLSLFKLTGDEFNFSDGDDTQIAEDKALIESARLMFAKVGESQDGFREIDELFYD
jgi:hypothetical protein